MRAPHRRDAHEVLDDSISAVFSRAPGPSLQSWRWRNQCSAQLTSNEFRCARYFVIGFLCLYFEAHVYRTCVSHTCGCVYICLPSWASAHPFWPFRRREGLPYRYFYLKLYIWRLQTSSTQESKAYALETLFNTPRSHRTSDVLNVIRHPRGFLCAWSLVPGLSAFLSCYKSRASFFRAYRIN